MLLREGIDALVVGELDGVAIGIINRTINSIVMPSQGEQQFAAVREMMARPEVQAMISQQQKAAIDARYAPLFKSLNLPPEQVDKLKALLAETWRSPGRLRLRC